MPDITPKRHALPRPAAASRRWTERLSAMGSWLLVWGTLTVCGIGSTLLLHTLKHSPTASLSIAGELTPSEQQVVYRAVVPTLKGGYFTSDLVAIRDAALSVSWIDQVTVTRRWPNGILLRAYPSHAVARWGGGRFLSDNGKVYYPLHYQYRPDLPVIHGPEAQSTELMAQFREINQWFSPLKLSLKEFYITDRQSAILIFQNGLRVVVDKERRQEKLQQLVILLKQELNPFIMHIDNIDLRYRTGLAVRFKEDVDPAHMLSAHLAQP